MSFTHETLGQRVMFGRGRAAEHLHAEVDRLGVRRVMLIASERDGAVDDLAAGLPVAVRWREVRQHVPVENAERARAAATGADVLVAVGGGSAIGLAKAVALTSGLPILAVPTTYAGSEGTNVWGLTEDGVKTTGVAPAVLPVSVIYDAALSASMPVELSVASGLNALAHCVDSLWAPRADPINTALALEGARALAAGLPAVVDDPASRAGRDDALYGTYLAAVAFASAGSALHHKICHVLGGAFDLPHAQTHAIVLPHVLALNAGAAPGAALRLAQALGTTVTATGPEAAVDALEALRVRLHAPRALRDHGLAEADLDEAATRCLAAVPPTNPVPVTIDDLRTLLHAAWAGDTPVLRERASRTASPMRDDEQAIRELEDRRFAAITAGDFDGFAAVCHPELTYTHSNGVTDTLQSYLDRCRSGYYVYHRVDHPVSRIVIAGDTALVLGEMNADLTAGGVRKQLRNGSLAVWVRRDGGWALIGYQPTPKGR